MLKYFVLFIILSFNCFANPVIDNSPPEWVIDIAAPNKAGSDDEILHYVLVDTQVDIDSETKFAHVMKRLNTNSAVQNYSSIEIEFDPSYESIALHELCVHRNNQKIDKIHSSRKEVIQQERDIDQHQFNGVKTWVIFLDGIQAGDLIEYSFSKKGRNPAYKGHYFDLLYFQNSFPVEYGHFRIIASSDRRLNFKPHNHAGIPTHRIQDDGKHEWIYEIVNVESYQTESSKPSWYIGFPFIQVSEFSNWHEVAEWGNKLFPLPGNYSEEMKQLVADWKEHYPEPEKQALQALRFVQNEVRYLGFELGEGSHVPTDPNLVLKQRYGDCKDKTLLLKALLSLLTIESDPVFVNSSIKEHIADWHPTAKIFDHVILQIHLNGRVIWVDPTCSQQGGRLFDSDCTCFGKGLVLNSNITDLSNAPKPEGISQVIGTTTISFNTSQKGASLTDETIYKGLEADAMRRYCHLSELKELGKSYTNYYSKKYGELEVIDPLTCEDNLEANELTLRSGYWIDDIWKVEEENGAKSIHFSAMNIYETMDFDILPVRTAPLKLVIPMHVIDNTILINQEFEWCDQPFQKKLESDEIAFSYEVKNNANHLHLRYELQTKKDHVPKESIGEHRKLLEKIEDYLFRKIEFPIEGEVAENQSNAGSILIGLIALFYVWILIMIMRKSRGS